MPRKRYDCTTCGACCIDWETSGVVPELEEDDVARLSDHYRRHHLRWFMSAPGLASKEVDGVTQCVALRGRVGQRVRCFIYNNRPHVCRCFKPGSEYCRDSRRDLIDAGLLKEDR